MSYFISYTKQVMNKTLSTLTSDQETLTAELNLKQGELTSLNKDLEDFKAKKDRVIKQVLVEILYVASCYTMSILECLQFQCNIP